MSNLDTVDKGNLGGWTNVYYILDPNAFLLSTESRLCGPPHEKQAKYT